MSKYRLRSRQSNKRSKSRSFWQTLPLITVGSIAAYVGLFYPGPTVPQFQNRVFSEGLKIELDRTSPAFAAMEDVLLGSQLTEFESLASLNQPAQVEMLEAGRAAGEALANMILRENRREAALMAQARAAREASARLMAQAAAEAFEKMATAFAAPQSQAVKSEPASPSPSKTIDGKVATTRVERRPSSVSASQAVAKSEYSHPTQTIRLSDLGLSREQFAKELLMPLATADVGDGPSLETMVAGGGSYRTITSKGMLQNPRLGGVDPRQRRLLPASGRGVNRPDLGNASSRGTKLNEESLKAFGEQPEPPHQLVIGGPIEFAGGLALTNPTDRVIVYRENEGQMLESGAVWLREGRYEIFVETAEGSLLAELRTPHGDILGRGTFDLDDLPRAPRQQYKIGSIALKIRPVPQGVVGHVLSANSFEGKKAPVPGTQITFEDLPFQAVSLKDGRFEEPNLLEGSVALLKAIREGHWNTLMFGTSGAENTIPLFPEKMMSAFTNIVSPGAKTGESGVIWGRVTRGGAAVPGARVELLTDNEVVRPVYFNSLMIPDPSMDATSANGLYAFYPVSAGTHAVQASLGNELSEPILLPTDARAVSSVDIDLVARQKSTVKVFDAFHTDRPLAGEITFPGMTNGFQVHDNGEGVLRYSAGNNLLILDAEAGRDYEPVRVVFPRDRRFIYIPMVQTSWLAGIKGAQKVNTEARTGTVIGFIQGTAPYQVSMDERNVGSGSRLLYFNSRGQVTDQQFGEPGGGFILVNIPDGFRSIVIQPRGTVKTFATTVLVESKITNVINHWIR